MTRLVVHVPRRLVHASWGGTERVLEQTLPLLSEHGFAATIYTSQALDAHIVDQLGTTPIIRFPYFYPEWPISAARKAIHDNKGGNTLSPSLARSLAEVPELSIVHCHTGGLLGAQCLRAARKRGVPVLLTLHGGYFAIPEAEVRSFTQQGGRAPRRGLPFGRVLSLALKARRLVHDVDALVCVGLDEYEAARKAAPSQRVVFLPGGVDVEAFAKADRALGRRLIGAHPERPLVVCVARVDTQKDQATLVKAWAHQMRADCDLALVGPETTPGYVAELRALAQGARGTLWLPGGIAPEHAPHLYAAADVSVLPSRHEPFGLTCLESWAAGTALVCANVGGPQWLLEQQREGRLFPVGDAPALGRVLDELLQHPDARQRLVEAGRARVGAEFTWRHHTGRLADLYETLLASPGAQRG